MGSNFITLTFKKKRNEGNQLAPLFAAEQEQDRYENGHSYSGTIGMAHGLSVTDKWFEEMEDAVEWVSENAQKWEEALAVYVDGEGWLIGAWCSS